MKKSSAKRSVNDRILFTLFCLFIFKFSQNLASLSLVASTIIAFSIFVHSLFAFLFLLPLLGLPPVFPFTSFVSRSHINTGSLHWLHWLSLDLLGCLTASAFSVSVSRWRAFFTYCFYPVSILFTFVVSWLSLPPQLVPVWLFSALKLLLLLLSLTKWSACSHVPRGVSQA